MSTNYPVLALSVMSLLGESTPAVAAQWNWLPIWVPEMSLPWNLLMLGLVLAALGQWRPFSRKSRH